MNILYFAPHAMWPANTGARLRDYQLALQLAACANVTFLEMRGAEETLETAPAGCGVAKVVSSKKERTYTISKLLRGLAGPAPVTVLNCRSRDAFQLLAETLAAGQFDTVQIEGVHLMEYLPEIRQAPGSPAVVVDWHNIESEAMRRYACGAASWVKRAAARRTANLLERAEDILLAALAAHTVTSERERQNLLARRPGANVQVIPNGVDSDHYSAANLAEARARSGGDSARKNLLFVGSMDYHANIDAAVWFARTSWPEIARNYPDMQFTIVGRDPSREVCALASERIRVTGTVDDVRRYYATAVAAVAPIRCGGGTRLKILEAMAAGVPVVSTGLGAEGIEAENGTHLLLADGEAEIAAAVGCVASSSELSSRLAQAGRSLVKRKYDWSEISAKLFGIHERLAEAPRPGLREKALAS